MELTQFLGYLGALAIGLVLGLLGGGGSILTVPVLVYLFYLNPVVATAYSLFVVGISALVGTLQNISKQLVDFKTAIVFAIPAFIAVYSTRKFIVPAIPDEIFSIGDFTITKNFSVMVFFALIMIIAAFSMIKNREGAPEKVGPVTYNYPFIIGEGLVVGLVTGIVGAGGGFLIIPALVLFAKLPMKRAVATSLLIISIKSLIGFIGDVENLNIDWPFLLKFTIVSVAGIFIGVWLNKFIDGKKLKKGFGWFVLAMSFYILYKEFSFLI